MPNLLDDHQAVHTMHKVVSAEDDNRVRLALKRLGNPLEVELTSVKCLKVILNDQYWLCLDFCVGDRPVMASTSFETSSRSALNAPVACKLKFYHVKAGMVMGEVLANIGHSMETMLDSKK